ncbi:MAG: septum site-determining protein MinC, partial [Hungatella hathewayi]
MSSTVVIKSNKSGMSVFLDPNIPLEQLLEDVARKFRESAKFWGSVQMTLTLEGRDLTPEEEFQIVNVITEHSQIEVLCLLDKDANRIKECEKALNEKLMELSSTTGQFFRGNLREGESLESESSIVIIGDVGKG